MAERYGGAASGEERCEFDRGRGRFAPGAVPAHWRVLLATRICSSCAQSRAIYAPCRTRAACFCFPP